MATLDEGSVGIKVLAGLPDANGLPAIAENLLDDPRPVYALVELRPRHEVHNIDTDSHTLVLRIAQIEPLAGAAADKLRDQLREVREKRTGVVALPGVDGVEAPAVDVALDTEPDGEKPPADLPTGPEWGDTAPGAAAEPTPVAAADTVADPAPPFTEPTPITKPRKGTG